MSTDVETRWRRLREQLREYRIATGLRGAHLANRLQWQQPKISKIENGVQRITDAELKAWLAACEVDPDEVEEIRAELRAIRLDEARWKDRLQSGHTALQQSFGELEQRAEHIRVFETVLVPGLVQTHSYALAVFRGLSALRGTTRDPDQAAAARMQRQTILYEPSAQVDILVSEAALRTPPPGVDPDGGWFEMMAGQIDRLLALVGGPAVGFRVLPLGMPLPAAPLHGFTILDDLVVAELLHTSIRTSDGNDYAFYDDLFRQLWDAAAADDAARSILLDVSAGYQQARR
ncbi:helix-turn-helix domain-containing protein [Prauserella halophila]|uniref:helix-turn-helix domain-containing protein n=1 Tax=Prauserella halophila TaxID=185641 RepID=UPI0020A234F0|nr:helix-turn-helix transcriptional regulator [Prauserella halophila]MCP2237644.1 Helix-turn-helix domain-containing protein [Prauserella halophila]